MNNKNIFLFIIKLLGGYGVLFAMEKPSDSQQEVRAVSTKKRPKSLRVSSFFAPTSGGIIQPNSSTPRVETPPLGAGVFVPTPQLTPRSITLPNVVDSHSRQSSPAQTSITPLSRLSPAAAFRRIGSLLTPQTRGRGRRESLEYFAEMLTRDMDIARNDGGSSQEQAGSLGSSGSGYATGTPSINTFEELSTFHPSEESSSDEERARRLSSSDGKSSSEHSTASEEFEGLPQQALYRFIGEDNSNGVATVLRHGATIVDLNENRTPIMIAASQGSDTVIHAMLNHYYPSATLNQRYYNTLYWRDQYGNTALILASRQGHVSVVTTLLNERWGLDINALINVRNNRGNTALMESSIRNHTECGELLLHQGADATIGSNEYNTPLHFACYRNNERLVQLLIAAGADILACNDQGDTPLKLARFAGNYRLWKKLIGIVIKQMCCCAAAAQ